MPAHESTSTATHANCWLASEDLPSFEPADEDTVRVLGMFRKILQRGSTPPLHPSAEWKLLELLDLADQVEPSDLPGDLTPVAKDAHKGVSAPHGNAGR